MIATSAVLIVIAMICMRFYQYSLPWFHLASKKLPSLCNGQGVLLVGQAEDRDLYRKRVEGLCCINQRFSYEVLR